MYVLAGSPTRRTREGRVPSPRTEHTVIWLVPKSELLVLQSSTSLLCRGSLYVRGLCKEEVQDTNHCAMCCSGKYLIRLVFEPSMALGISDDLSWLHIA